MSCSDCTLSRSELEQLLRDDVPYGDLTLNTLAIGSRPGRMTFHVRDAMVICGVEEAACLLELAGATVERHAASGEAAEPGHPLLSATGPAAALFTAWKVAQTLIESASGVSTAARSIVDRAGGTAVACTRKHFPGIKPMMVKAVHAGGASMHRLGLSETVMVTAEHRAFLDPAELGTYLAKAQRALPEKKIIVEVDELAAALALVQSGCDVIQLEKLSLEAIGEVAGAAAAIGSGRPVIAAAGGINGENAAAYAATGVDVLVTSAPYFAKPRDVQVRFERLPAV